MESRRDVVAPRGLVILGMAAVAACVLALLLPWYSANRVGADGVQEMSWEYGFFGYSWTGLARPAAYPGQVLTIAYNYSHEPETGALLAATGGLTAAGLAAGVGTLAVVTWGPARRRLARWAPALPFAAAAVLLVATLAMMLLFPLAQGADARSPALAFWGTATYPTNAGTSTEFWGPGWAWYVAISAAILFLSAGLLLRKERRSAELATARDSGPAA